MLLEDIFIPMFIVFEEYILIFIEGGKREYWGEIVAGVAKKKLWNIKIRRGENSSEEKRIDGSENWWRKFSTGCKVTKANM